MNDMKHVKRLFQSISNIDHYSFQLWKHCSQISAICFNISVVVSQPSQLTGTFEQNSVKLIVVGFYVDEHMDFVWGTTVLAEAASRALRGDISKLKLLKILVFLHKKNFSRLVFVQLVGAAVWGHGS